VLSCVVSVLHLSRLILEHLCFLVKQKLGFLFFTGRITDRPIAKPQIVAIENGKREVFHPITKIENNSPRGTMFGRQVKMTGNDEFSARRHPGFAIRDYFLAVGFFLGRTAHSQTPAFPGNAGSQPDRIIRVNMPEKTNDYPIAEDMPHQPVSAIALENAIRMGKVKTSSAYVSIYRLVVNVDAKSIAEKAADPVIVITTQEMHFATSLDRFAQLAQDREKHPGNHMAVFKPEVEHVAKDIQSAVVPAHFCEEIVKPLALNYFFRAVVKVQVYIGNEVGNWTHSE